MILKINLDNHKIQSFAIRKLTPRECFRLMGVSEPTIDRMQECDETGQMKISASQQYKQAGNSIVVDVLYYIFNNCFYPNEQMQQMQQLQDSLPEGMTIDETGQMSLF